MKLKGVVLEWYVLHWNPYTKRVENSNILAGIKENVAKEIRSKKISDINTLKVYLKRQFMYNYWSKTECEFYVSDVNGNNYEKIDMWRQIEPNLDRIVAYVNSKMDLNLK